ncbi:choice-of-anchor B family protein [Gramella sp. BOM4]|nr:choice-of-anchor B family protein [Christiangramia bathymodioli]
MTFVGIITLSCSSDNDPVETNEDNSGVPEEPDTPEEVESGFQACQNGMAGIYPCSGYDLMGHLNLQELTGTDNSIVNDLWGWTDPSDGKEYVIIGTDILTAFVDISNPEKPIVVGRLESGLPPDMHADIKVYQDHAYIVSEAEGHGMKVFDLKQLRDVSDHPEDFDATTVYIGFSHAHNLAINEDSGYAYVIGTDAYEGGTHFVNISNSSAPVAAGGYTTEEPSHDAQVVSYSGPDAQYTGREIYVGSHGNEILILDVTNKDEPEIISRQIYENLGYVHQGWFTDDQKYFFLGDELDEIENSFNTRTLVFDFTDLDDPVLHMEYFGRTAAIDHNGYTQHNQFFLASYSAGLRVLDISTLENKEITEIGYFDTLPDTDEPFFGGAWSVYPFFESGNIAISDMGNGLFIVRKSDP